MNYEINVATKNGHLFATAPRSCQSNKAFKEVYCEISERFPESDGYKISVSRNECTGIPVGNDELFKLINL